MSDSQFVTEIANENGSVPTTALESTDQQTLFDKEQAEKTRLLQEVVRDVKIYLQKKRQDEEQKPKQGPSSYVLKAQEERDADNAKPFLDRQLWRKRWMYRGWSEEEILWTPTDRSAFTRSHYGYEVLNTPDLGVVDVDFNIDYDVKAQQCESLSNLKAWCAVHPQQSFRAYKTAAGLRYLRTDAPMPLDADYDVLCEMVAADEVYRYMCRQEQNCFRVRISPKPARIRAEWPNWNPYSGWNYDPTPATVANYEAAAARFKTCEYLGTVGSGVIDPMLKPLIDLHDRKCRIEERSLEMEEPLSEECTVQLRDIDAVVFNRKYRPDGSAPELLWQALDANVTRQLLHLDDLDNVAAVMREHNRCVEIERKWQRKFKRVILDFVTPTKSLGSYEDYKLWASEADRKELEAYWDALPDADFERLIHDIEDDLDLDKSSGRAITPTICVEHKFAWQRTQRARCAEPEPPIGSDDDDDWFTRLAAQSESD